MMRKTLKRAGIGFLLGTNVGNLIAFISAQGHEPIVSQELLDLAGYESTAMFIQTILSGILGAIAFAGISFYDIEEWSMLKTMVSHYALIMATYIPIALSLRWLKPNEIIVSSLIQAVCYLIIWVIMNERYKAEVRKLNELIEARDKETADQECSR